MGRKGVADCLEKAMAERDCAAGVYVSQSAAGFTAEVGEWAEGSTEAGPFVAVTDDCLLVGLRFLIVQRRLSRLREARREIDEAAVATQVERIKTAMTRIATIKRLVGDVLSSVDAIEADADGLRSEIKGALTVIEESLAAAS